MLEEKRGLAGQQAIRSCTIQQQHDQQQALDHRPAMLHLQKASTVTGLVADALEMPVGLADSKAGDGCHQSAGAMRLLQADGTCRRAYFVTNQLLQLNTQQGQRL